MWMSTMQPTKSALLKIRCRCFSKPWLTQAKTINMLTICCCHCSRNKFFQRLLCNHVPSPSIQTSSSWIAGHTAGQPENTSDRAKLGVGTCDYGCQWLEKQRVCGAAEMLPAQDRQDPKEKVLGTLFQSMRTAQKLAEWLWHVMKCYKPAFLIFLDLGSEVGWLTRASAQAKSPCDRLELFSPEADPGSSSHALNTSSEFHWIPTFCANAKTWWTIISERTTVSIRSRGKTAESMQWSGTTDFAYILIHASHMQAYACL